MSWISLIASLVPELFKLVDSFKKENDRLPTQEEIEAMLLSDQALHNSLTDTIAAWRARPH